MSTLVNQIAKRLRAAGVRRMFGIPGGGSSLDLIEAARLHDIEFVVTRTEAAATIMAAVTGEMTGVPGVALVGVGPGASSATNGLAYASLERSPMFLFIDGPASSAHQHFDQQALYAPITKATAHLHGPDAMARFMSAWQQAVTSPLGPVMFEFTAAEAVTDTPEAPVTDNQFAPPSARYDESWKKTLSMAQKPIAVIGLQARHHADRIRDILKKYNVPAVMTYKALGVVSSDSGQFIGPITGAVGENQVFNGADAVIGIGFDPIEFIPGQWPTDLPAFTILSEADISNPRIPIGAAATGALPELLDALDDQMTPTAWTTAEITMKRTHLREIYTPRGETFSCAAAIQMISEATPHPASIACDAGAHMFSTLGLWPSMEPFGVLKSNGLSTMGYALPAAIAHKLINPENPTIAITGDGGMSMCLGELATAKELGLDITIIVMNDAALSLIDIKQQRQQRLTTGVRYPTIDYSAIAAAFGWTSAIAHTPTELRDALRITGPKLIDARVDPAGYLQDMERLRG